MGTVVRTPTKSGIRVLHKTLDILEVIRDAHEGVTLADISRSVAFPKATVYRILNTLEGRGYLDRACSGGYRVSKKLFEMQRDLPLQQLVARAAHPWIAWLVNESQETVHLGVLEGGEVVVMDTMESPQAVRMSCKIGSRAPLHATAIGKILLSGLTDQEVLRLMRLKGQPRMTPNTIVSPTALLSELGKIRKQGFAISNQENEMEARCIGAPILDSEGRVLAALGISSPAFRMEVPRALTFLPRLKEVCSKISADVRV